MLLVNAATVARARKRYVEEGLEAAINDRPRPGQERKLDGKQEAHPVSSTGQALNTHQLGARYEKHLSQAKLGASPNAWSFITLPRTAAG